MYTVDVDCSLGYEVMHPAEFLVQIQAAPHAYQRIVTEELYVTGIAQPEHFLDHNGLNRLVRFSALPGPLEVRYTAVIELQHAPRDSEAREIAIGELPSDILHYLLPSRYCESDLLSAMAIRTFGGMKRGFNRIEAVCDWIKTNIAYEIGSSQPSTTARDVLAQRAGVCRDFAHLGVALCRALNIPARFVFGYAEFDDPPPDFHALFEAYVQTDRGQEWMLFDPTKMVPTEKIVRIGTGTDAKDVAFATMYGQVKMTYMKPLVRDHVVGRAPEFEPHEVSSYIGAPQLVSPRAALEALTC